LCGRLRILSTAIINFNTHNRKKAGNTRGEFDEGAWCRWEQRLYRVLEVEDGDGVKNESVLNASHEIKTRESVWKGNQTEKQKPKTKEDENLSRAQHLLFPLIPQPHTDSLVIEAHQITHAFNRHTVRFQNIILSSTKLPTTQPLTSSHSQRNAPH